MMLGMHWTAWLLLAAATVPGLALGLRFYLRHRGGNDPPPGRSESGMPP